jgi:hypothetical protein
MMTPEPQVLEEASACVRRMLGGTVLDACMIRAGGNNRIVRVERRGEPPCVVKIYFRHPADRRDRLATEYGALSFLWRHGVRRTPQPLAADGARGMAIYGFIAGAPIASDAIGPSEIAAAVEMLDALHALRTAEGADRLPPASEAFFTLDGLVANLHERWARHAGIVGGEPVLGEYQAFRDGALWRAVREIEEAARVSAQEIGGELALTERTLSPSDFGLHNAVRAPAGGIVFLDFEYFGWDDPAKTVCDFCYHPAMALSPALRALFADAAVDRLGGERLRRRIRLLFPIFGLKWCFILLNEFLPEGRLRRALASGRSEPVHDLMSLQLAKAKAMLDRVINERERDGFAGIAS